MASPDLSRLLELHGALGIDVVESPALRGNALGDPSERPLAVYTPPGYDPESSKRFPVLYVLHGFTGDVAAVVSASPWNRNVVQRVDRLIADGSMPPCILVVVDGFTRLGGSQYVDSIHNGNYATYVVRDVVDYVDRAYRTIAREGGRAVLGKSSGGFGSLHLVMTHPGTFASFASHSGDAGFGYCYPDEFPAAQRTLEKYGSIEAFLEEFERRPKRPPEFFATINQLGMAAAYSPRAAERFAIDLPFDLATGEMRDDVFARWMPFDPAEACLGKRAEFERLRVRYVDCGRRDEYALDIGARILVQRLRSMEIEVTHEEFDDDHRNIQYRYDVSLPILATSLDLV
jgi:hypothetical protein